MAGWERYSSSRVFGLFTPPAGWDRDIGSRNFWLEQDSQGSNMKYEMGRYSPDTPQSLGSNGYSILRVTDYGLEMLVTTNSEPGEFGANETVLVNAIPWNPGTFCP